MLNIIQKNENRLDIELSGKLNTEDMKVALNELANKSEGITHGKMLYKIEDFNLPSLCAIGVELSRLPSMFKLMRQFDRIAILTEKNWIKKASEIEGAIIPGLDIKAFDLNQKQEAEMWLSN